MDLSRYTKVLFFIVLSGLFVLPCFDVSIYEGYDEKRIYEVIALSAVIALLLFDDGLIQSIQNLMSESDSLKPGWYLITGFFVIGLVSAFNAISTSNAIIEWLQWVGLTILLLIIAGGVKLHSSFFLKLVSFILLGFVSLYIFQVLVEYGLHFTSAAKPLWPHRSDFILTFDGVPVNSNNIGFENVRYFNHLQTWTLPLLVAGIGMIPKKLWAWRRLLLGILSCWWMLVFASAARGTFLGLVLSAGLIWLYFGKHSHRFLGRFALALLLGGALYIVIYKWIPAETESMKSIVRSNISNRLNYWSNALQLFRENWLLGIGPMHYAHVDYQTEVAAPHNMYLQVLTEWGVIAFGFLAWTGINGYINWIKEIKKKLPIFKTPEASIRLGLTMSISAALMHAFVSGIMNSPLSQLWGVIVIGWMIALYQKDKSQSDKNLDVGFKSGYMIFAKVFLLFIVISYGYLLYPQISNLQDRTEKYRQQYNSHIVYPRFWNQGKFGFE